MTFPRGLDWPAGRIGFSSTSQPANELGEGGREGKSVEIARGFDELAVAAR